MALTQSYLVTTKNLESFFAAIQSAKAPERFTTKFLTQLDFSSSNDRLFLGLLKSLGFIDEAGVPTKRYYAFLDQSESGKVLAEATREAYEDLFAINKQAQNLSIEEVKNKFKTLTQGQKSENVIGLMAATFKALAALADWTGNSADVKSLSSGKDDVSAASVSNTPIPRDSQKHQEDHTKSKDVLGKSGSAIQLRYDIHIHLPESRDPAVFDAIFDAMRKHLGA